jgi:hypothetical protein
MIRSVRSRTSRSASPWAYVNNVFLSDFVPRAVAQRCETSDTIVQWTSSETDAPITYARFAERFGPTGNAAARVGSQVDICPREVMKSGPRWH